MATQRAATAPTSNAAIAQAAYEAGRCRTRRRRVDSSIGPKPDRSGYRSGPVAGSRSMRRSMRAGCGALTACGMLAGMRTMVPGTAGTSLPPIVSVNEPSSTMTSASKGDVCSVRSWPESNANRVRLPPAVRASTRLAMPCSVGVTSECKDSASAGGMVCGFVAIAIPFTPRERQC